MTKEKAMVCNEDELCNRNWQPCCLRCGNLSTQQQKVVECILYFAIRAEYVSDSTPPFPFYPKLALSAWILSPTPGFLSLLQRSPVDPGFSQFFQVMLLFQFVVSSVAFLLTFNAVVAAGEKVSVADLKRAGAKAVRNMLDRLVPEPGILFT